MCCLNFHLFLWGRLLWAIFFSATGTLGDPCSWFGSGGAVLTDSKLLGDAEQSIQPVRLSCEEGKIQWVNPIGALLVQYQFEKLHSSHLQQYRFCLRPLRRNKNSSVYKRDNKTLVPLVTVDSQNEVCFDSDASPTLFLQKMPVSSQSYQRDSVSGFFYSAKPLIQKPYTRSPTSDCEPCSTRELLDAFCSSTFIFKGKFKAAQDRKEDGQEINFVIEKLIRKPVDYSEVLSRIRYAKKTKMQGSVLSPSDCTMDLGFLTPMDSYLVVSDMNLGRARLRCGILWSDWVNLINSKKVDSPCELK